MNQIRGLAARASRRVIRRVIQAASLVAGACAVLVLGYTLYAVNTLPPLQPWHTTRLKGEFSALTDTNLDFAGYQVLERRLFAAAAVASRDWSSAGEAYEFSRFNPAGFGARLSGGAPFNQSFRLTPPHPVGGALLVHGLTDSPYSLRAVAEVLRGRGFEVTVLRLPGHGTFPSMMTEMHYLDWVAAVRLAARDVAARTGPGRPFYVGGYSTGATLTLNYALDALGDHGLRRPDRILLMSPAIELAPVAALANVIDVLSVVPLPVLDKVRWQEILPEYDPYKFNSFPVNAARQVNRATKTLRDALLDAGEDGRLAQLAPVVTWQSVVDSTVGSAGTVDRLYAHLAGGRHRLVIFDVNRYRMLNSLQRPGARALIDRAVAANHGYTLEVVGNTGPDSRGLAVTRYGPGEVTPRSVEALTESWPADVVALGHVSLPFRPDDPVYGINPGSGRDGLPSIGSLLLRGENGALSLSLGSLTRLRSNPFWDLIERQLDEMVTSDLAGPLPKEK